MYNTVGFDQRAADLRHRGSGTLTNSQRLLIRLPISLRRCANVWFQTHIVWEIEWLCWIKVSSYKSHRIISQNLSRFCGIEHSKCQVATVSDTVFPALTFVRYGTSSVVQNNVSSGGHDTTQANIFSYLGLPYWLPY